MRAKTKVCAVTAVAFFACLLALMPQAAGAGSITLTPTAQAPGAIVSVSGTGFGATGNVVVAFGREVNAANQPFVIAITGAATRGYNWTVGPIKPGSFVMHLRDLTIPTLSDQIYDYADDGAGNIKRVTTGAFWGIIDYALGGILRNSTNNPLDYELTVDYTCYSSANVTSYGRVTTSGSGAFSANFTVPSVANGNYAVTAIDSGGNLATATLNVNNTIPEGLPLGAILLLCSAAVVTSSRHFRARAKK